MYFVHYHCVDVGDDYRRTPLEQNVNKLDSQNKGYCCHGNQALTFSIYGIPRWRLYYGRLRAGDVASGGN